MAIQSGDLVGTKNDSNVVFTIPVVPIAGSEWIIVDGDIMYPVGSFSASPSKECIISGQTVTLGLAPHPTSHVHFKCDAA